MWRAELRPSEDVPCGPWSDPGHLSPNLGLRESQTTESQLLTGNLCSQHRAVLIEEINKSGQEH